MTTEDQYMRPAHGNGYGSTHAVLEMKTEQD